jgi:hypothetical protein
MVILKEEELKEIADNVHHDLGHYGRGSTVDTIRKRFVLFVKQIDSTVG